MNNIPKVSVIIPVYNVEQYLRQCLDSVVNQTFEDIEIIVVNDCSPDNSLKIIEEYKQKDERFVIVDLKKNVGLGFARNEGMKVAKGKYITFIDSDDYVSKDFVEILYKTIEKYQYDVISPDFYCYDDITKKISDSRHPKEFYNVPISTITIKQKLLYCEDIHYARKIFRLQFLKDNNIVFKINKLEDTLFTWEIVLKTNKFMFIDDKIYFYRVNRKGSIMATTNTEFSNNMNLFYALKELMDKDANNKKYFDPVLNFFLMNRLFNYAWKYPDIFQSVYPKFKEKCLDNKNTRFAHTNTIKSFCKSKVFSFAFKSAFRVIYVSLIYRFEFKKIVHFIRVKQKQSI